MKLAFLADAWKQLKGSAGVAAFFFVNLSMEICISEWSKYKLS